VDRSVQNTLSPQPIPTEAFHDAAAAVVRLTEIYERNTEFLWGHFAAYLKGKRPARRVRACYPIVRITTGTFARVDSRLSYGFVSGPGVHETSAPGRPDSCPANRSLVPSRRSEIFQRHLRFSHREAELEQMLRPRRSARGTKSLHDSLLERAGFELSVPGERISVLSLRTSSGSNPVRLLPKGPIP
jgi:hypothetical protein